MQGSINPEVFVRVYEDAVSITEATVRLMKMGFAVTPLEVRRLAWALRHFGMAIKVMPSRHARWRNSL